MSAYAYVPGGLCLDPIPAWPAPRREPKVTLKVQSGDTVVGPRELTQADFAACSNFQDFRNELEGNWVCGFGMGLPEDAIAILDVDGIVGRLRLDSEGYTGSWKRAVEGAYGILVK
jgi:hypothetical protein